MKNTSYKLPATKVLILMVVTGILFTCLSVIACSDERLSATGEQTVMDILKNTMIFIKAHHPDAAALINDNISFTLSTGDRQNQGYTRVICSGGGWTVSIGHAITPDNIYDIRAEYVKGQIVWVGSSKNGQIREESYINSG